MKVALLYGHLASNLGDLAVTSGAISLMAPVVGLENIRLIVPPLSDVATGAVKALEAIHGTLDLRIVEDALVGAVKGREPENVAALDVFGDLITQPTEVLKRNGLEDVDVLVFNSGEHLFAGGSLREGYALAGRLMPLIAGAAVGRKVICLPSTLGPFEDPVSTALARLFIKQSSAVALREAASRHHLEKIGLDADDLGIQTLLDPGFFIEVPRTAATSPGDPELVSVVVRLDQFGMRIGGRKSSEAVRAFRSDGFRQSSAFQFYTAIIGRTLSESRQRVQILVQTSSDLELSNAILDSVVSANPSFGHRIQVRRPPDIAAFLTALAAGGSTIASRFHAIVLSFLLDRPALGVYFPEHGHKIPGLMTLFGMSDFAIQGTTDHLERAVELAHRLYDENADLRSQVHAKRTLLSDDTKRWLSVAVGKKKQPIKRTATV